MKQFLRLVSSDLISYVTLQFVLHRSCISACFILVAKRDIAHRIVVFINSVLWSSIVFTPKFVLSRLYQFVKLFRKAKPIVATAMAIIIFRIRMVLTICMIVLCNQFFILKRRNVYANVQSRRPIDSIMKILRESVVNDDLQFGFIISI